jgi:hypothetical protein
MACASYLSRIAAVTSRLGDRPHSHAPHLHLHLHARTHARTHTYTHRHTSCWTDWSKRGIPPTSGSDTCRKLFSSTKTAGGRGSSTIAAKIWRVVNISIYMCACVCVCVSCSKLRRRPDAHIEAGRDRRTDRQTDIIYIHIYTYIYMYIYIYI